MTNKRRQIELLAPARTAEIGMEAVLHGADAVYIGGPAFGARVAAGNSLEDIECLCRFAHIYYAKVYVTLNTILTDAELAEAEQLIWRLYEIGVDALIVQDFGITQLNLPPIALHASTQMDTRTPEKALFLEKCGFQQVVLARELTHDEIKKVADNTSVRLEAFVHGALCVSYSGRCFLSCALTNRSANKGACAQLCRIPYTLTDEHNRVIAKDKRLLSLKDFNLSAHLLEMMEAGVSSFKIEGRLKDAEYVKNVTAYYNRAINEIISKDSRFERQSSGVSAPTFTPCLGKSFNRGFTTYFFNGRQPDIASMQTPKSQGEVIGKVVKINKNSIEVNTSMPMNNGDGFCYFSENGDFMGFKANRVEGKTIFPLSMPLIKPGTLLRRNFDAAFEKTLSKPTAERKIEVMVGLKFQPNDRFCLEMQDEDGLKVTRLEMFAADDAQNAEKAENTIRQQLSKTGNTPFVVKDVDIEMATAKFLPASVLADWRRNLVEDLLKLREEKRARDDMRFPDTDHEFSQAETDFHANVYNKKAALFYKKHGIEQVADAYEAGKENGEVELMLCRHCIRHSLGACLKNGDAEKLPQRLYLVDSNGNRLRLEFDCRHCQMKVLGSRKK